MRRLLLLILVLHSPLLTLRSQSADSLRVVRLLEQGQHEATLPLHLWYARQLMDVPYVGQTLEVNPLEKLVVNLHQLDCTTFVETALALALTHRQGSVQYADYCRNLARIRYRGGVLDGYPSRNHYFTQWIMSNEGLGIVQEITGNGSPFTATQTIDLHYMSNHPGLYPMLRDDTAAQRLIRQYEQEASGRTVCYIPLNQLNGTKSSPLGLIRDGDILAIVTRKDGLDTSHIGFAVWGTDGRLHLLNSSQIHKKVVMEPMTLFQYMRKHPSQLGVRVVRPTI